MDREGRRPHARDDAVGDQEDRKPPVLLGHLLARVLQRERPVYGEGYERDGEQPTIYGQPHPRHGPVWDGQYRVRAKQTEEDQATDLQDLDRLAAPPHAQTEKHRDYKRPEQAGEWRDETHQYEEGQERREPEQDAHGTCLRSVEIARGPGTTTPEAAPAARRRIASRWIVRKSGFAGSLPARCNTTSPRRVAQNT